MSKSAAMSVAWDDAGEPGQFRVVQVVFGDEGFEGAPFALPARRRPVGELGPGRVERMTAVSLGRGQGLVGGHIDDLSIGSMNRRVSQ